MNFRPAEFWSNRVDTYEKQYGLDKPMSKLKRERKAKILIEMTGINSESLVLELGCGTGLYTEELVKTGCTLIATDASATMLERTRERMKVFTRLEDATRLSMPDDSVDVVVAAYVLQHINTAKALSEIRRVLRRNGKCAFVVPNIMNPLSFMYAHSFTKPLLHEKSITKNYTVRQWAEMMSKAGFYDFRYKVLEFVSPWIPESLIPLALKVNQVCEAIPFVNLFGGTLIVGGTSVD